MEMQREMEMEMGMGMETEMEMALEMEMGIELLLLQQLVLTVLQMIKLFGMPTMDQSHSQNILLKRD